MEKLFASTNVIYEFGEEKYTRNRMALVDEDGKPLEYNVVKRQIQREVFSYIHKAYSNIIVLVGAGASVLCKEGNVDDRFGKTVSMLAQIINNTLKDDRDLFSLQEMVSLCKYDFMVESIQADGTISLNKDFNLENFLSDMLSFEKYVSDEVRDKYIRTKSKIFDIIKNNTNYEYDGSLLRHSAFINTISQLVKTPSKLSIVTTNYDTLIEDAADTVNYTVIDGFSFSHRPYFDSDMFEWNLVKDIENIKTKELEYKKNIINLIKLHGSLTWERDEVGIRRKEKEEVSNPIMIFPSSDKYMQSYQYPYFELFTKFQELLKRPNTLLITAGFSFADNHISQMITQAIMRNRSMATLITDFCISQNNPNWIKLEDLMQHNYQIAFLKATMNDELTDFLGECYDD